MILYKRKHCSLRKILRITVIMILIQNVFSVWLHCAVHANLGMDYYTRLVNVYLLIQVIRRHSLTY